MREWRRSRAAVSATADRLRAGLQQRIERVMDITMGREMQRLERHMIFLASVGSAAPFMSRGDDSGTHKKEKSLWKAAGMAAPDTENWYVQTGQGMLATINVAQERKGYTMTDRGTYIKYQDQQGGKAPLKVLVEGDTVLLNQYSVVTLDPNNCPGADYTLARKFSDWMASSQAQELIKGFRLLGQKLFIPNAQ
ncbi:MAG: substrate-binding domain-containing protein [Desulfobacterales bacterium]|nr:substrate-binding domain-containing protein [Desulfobacterales bacterium]